MSLSNLIAGAAGAVAELVGVVPVEVELDVVEGFGAPKKEVMLEFTLGFLFAFESPADRAPASVFRFALDMVMGRDLSAAGDSLRAGSSPQVASLTMIDRAVAAVEEE